MNIQIEEVSAIEAWKSLTGRGDTVLVDVRTRAEWSYVGVPVLDEAVREPIFCEIISFPDGKPNGNFVAQLQQHLGTAKNAPAIYFLCRSGQRSRIAAMSMAEAGYGKCYNISDGFEGDLDEKGQRGHINGWRHAGLPWQQG